MKKGSKLEVENSKDNPEILSTDGALFLARFLCFLSLEYKSISSMTDEVEETP